MAVSKTITDLTPATLPIAGVSEIAIQNGATVRKVEVKELPISDAVQGEIDRLDGLDAENVKLTGDQTIPGVKTFSSSPVVPTPTTSGQAASKGYVDGLDAENVKLTGDQDVDGVKTFLKQIVSTLPDGTAPLSVVSKTLVTNLNGERINGTRLKTQRISTGSGGNSTLPFGIDNDMESGEIVMSTINMTTGTGAKIRTPIGGSYDYFVIITSTGTGALTNAVRSGFGVSGNTDIHEVTGSSSIRASGWVRRV
jgi:hypothetical protein